LFMIAAALFLSFMALFVKMLGKDMGPFQIVFIRSFIQGLIVLIALLIMRINPFGQVR
jgi:hypothetical protein